MVAYVDHAGHLAVVNRSAFRAALAAKFADQDVIVSVQSKTIYRSLRANNYYHAVVLEAAVQETGQDADTIHEFWCEQFLPRESKQIAFFNKVTGQRIKARVDTRRSSKLTGAAFYTFVEQCRQWLVEWLGVTTPDPDPAFWRKRTEVPQ